MKRVLSIGAAVLAVVATIARRVAGDGRHRSRRCHRGAWAA